MKPESICEQMRVEISARLDGEVDRATESLLSEHLATCKECRAYERQLSQVRRLVRVQAAERVPDLSGAIMDRIAALPSRNVRSLWPSRARIAAIAAAAAMLLLAGTVLPLNEEQPSDVAGATEIARRVRIAAAELKAYEATFTITERGWHPAVGERHFVVDVSYEAPETFMLEMRDRTDYPSSEWSANDVVLQASSDEW